MGCASLILILIHVLLLAWSEAVQSRRPPPSNSFSQVPGFRIFAGTFALFGMTTAMIMTFLLQLKHETFVYVQRSFGLVFILASYHVFRVEGTKAYSNGLTIYMGGLTALAIAAFVYRSILGRYLIGFPTIGTREHHKS